MCEIMKKDNKKSALEAICAEYEAKRKELDQKRHELDVQRHALRKWYNEERAKAKAADNGGEAGK